MNQQDEIEAQAVAWLCRINDPAFAAWVDFETWMAAGPACRDAYWALAMQDALLVDALRTSEARPTHARSPVWKKTVWWATAAMVAGVVSVVSISSFHQNSLVVRTMIVESAPGKTRAVRLRDGTEIALNGGTRLVLNASSPRTVRLDRGQASFNVIHDSMRPFKVVVGAAQVEDLGTIFDVTRTPVDTRVAVVEGEVDYRRAGDSRRLLPGQVLTDVNGRTSIASRPADEIEGWRSGRLSYQQALLGEVAQDLGRALGVPITVDASAAALRFSGSIQVRGREETRRTLEPLLGVKITPSASGWRIAASTTAH